MKILTIGGATQDIFLRHKEGADTLQLTKKYSEENYMIFKAGEKIELDEIIYATGGGSTNSATSFKRLGFQTSCFCKIGKDEPGEIILKKLSTEGIDASNIVRTSNHSSGKSFIINSLSGERTIFVFRGANSFIKKENLPLKAIEKSDLIYVTSLSHGSSSLLPDITKHAKKHNILVATNPGTSQLAKGATILKNSLKQVDILILNSSEAKTLMFSLMKSDVAYQEISEPKITDHISEKLKLTASAKTPKEEKAHLLHTTIMHEDLCFNLRTFFKETLKLGPKTVVVTDGKQGVYVAKDNEILFHPSVVKTEIVDTLGAGDAFGSSFVATLVKTENIEAALRAGIINSASVISYIGAKQGLLTWGKMQKKSDGLDKTLLQHYPL